MTTLADIRAKRFVPRHCEERSDAAIQFKENTLWIASAMPRNDKACG